MLHNNISEQNHKATESQSPTENTENKTTANYEVNKAYYQQYLSPRV